MPITPANNEPVISRMISFDRDYGPAVIGPIVDQFEREINEAENRSRGRSGRKRQQLRGTLKAVLLDLLVTYAANERRWLRYHRGKPWYLENKGLDGTGRYHNQFVTQPAVVAVVDHLRSCGLVEHLDGFNDRRPGGKSRLSCIRATDRLYQRLSAAGVDPEHVGWRRDREGIRLKALKQGEAAHLRGYRDTARTRRMRSSLERINAMLAGVKVSLEVKDRDGYLTDRLEKQLRDIHDGKDARKDLDFSVNQLYRIFNNGTFEDGGRFYGGWWQSIGEDTRRNICIDGEETIELDYEALHARLLHHQSGLDWGLRTLTASRSWRLEAVTRINSGNLSSLPSSAS